MKRQHKGEMNILVGSLIYSNCPEAKSVIQAANKANQSAHDMNKPPSVLGVLLIAFSVISGAAITLYLLIAIARMLFGG